jgi:hypothetical protein
MTFLTYEQYNEAVRAIKMGTDAAGNVAAAALFEIPVIGPLIGKGLGKLLSWGLLKLLERIPHGNEPRPHSFDWMPLHKPGEQKYVQDPRWITDDSKIKEALDKLRVPDIPNSLRPIVPINPIESLRVSKPIGFTVNYLEPKPKPGILYSNIKVSDHPRKQTMFNATIPQVGFN